MQKMTQIFFLGEAITRPWLQGAKTHLPPSVTFRHDISVNFKDIELKFCKQLLIMM